MIYRCVIDVGNTSIASALFYKDEIVTPLRESTHRYTTVANVAQLISDVDGRSGKQCEAIIACIGVASVRELFEEYALNASVPISFVSGDNLAGAQVSYETPETLGPDRIANTIAATQLRQ